MPEPSLSQLSPDMEVCDLTGQKVGTISHIYRRIATAVTSGGGMTPPAAEPVTRTYAEAIEVKSGFLGLGARLYVPIGAVQEVLNDCRLPL